MRKRNDPDKYAKVDWRSLVELDPESPTGIKWKVDVPGLQKSCIGGQAGYVTVAQSRGRPPYLKKALHYQRNYYSTTNIVRILKGEDLTTTKIDTPFRSEVSEWINKNPENVWWSIHQHLQFSSNKAKARKGRAINHKGTYDPDFLQDVFTDACLNFNRSYTKSKGTETNYMFHCARSAVSKTLDRWITRAIHDEVLGDKHDDTDSYFKNVPASQEEESSTYLEELKDVLNQEANALFTYNESQPNCSARTKRARAVFQLSMEGKHLQQIANILGLSKERVRQIRQEYTSKLRKRLVAKHVL